MNDCFNITMVWRLEYYGKWYYGKWCYGKWYYGKWFDLPTFNPNQRCTVNFVK